MRKVALRLRYAGLPFGAFSALAAFGAPCAAQGVSTCPAASTSCAVTNQTLGDTSNPSSAMGTVSTSSQSGTSAASTASGLTYAPDNRATVAQNSTNTTTGMISGGNTTSNGGTTRSDATGNSSMNQSSATTGPSSAATGASTSMTGASTSSSGGNMLGGATVGNTTTGASSSGGNMLGGATATGGNAVVGNTTAGGATIGNLSTGGSSVGNVSTGPATSTVGNLSTGAATVGNTSTGPATAMVGNLATGASTSTIGNTSTGPSSAAVGNTTTGSNMNTTGASNSSTTVDASDRSSSNYSSKLIFIPAIIPPTPPTALGVGNIIKDTSSCGPLQRVIREPVEGTFYGVFGKSHVPQGFTERLVAFVDAGGVQVDYRQVPISGGGYRLFGHQVTQYTAVIGVGGARNIAIGGGAGGGAWGQAGAGASASMQQMVTTIQLRECEIGSFVPPAPPRIIYEEPKHIRQ